jgi:DNA-binding CsgD family transcriptional regulator
LALLTGGDRAALPRHQTLRTTIDWSYDLLTPAEQMLFRRLCVFAARFTLEDVESVCTSDEVPVTGALDILSALVDKSLVTKEDVRGLACYRLHETLREYASLKLEEADEERLLEERCLEHYRLRCLRSADRARYRLVEWLAWAELEIDNIRAVLQQCLVRGDSARGLDIAASMKYYWITHGTTEGLRWLDPLLASGDASPPTLVRAYYLRGWLSLLQADPAGARPWIARAIATARETGQPALLSESLSIAATVENVSGERKAARRYLDEAGAITPGLDDFPATIELVQSRAIQAIVEGDAETLRDASLEGVRISREAGDLYQLEAMLRNLGVAGLMSGDFHRANSQFTAALQVARAVDNRLTQFYGLGAAGWYAAKTGQGRAAAQLLGAAEALGTHTGADIMGPLVPMLAQAKELAIGMLGASKFQTEFQAGSHLSRDAALRLALGESDQAEVASSDAAEGTPLGKRELEVARLVTDGLSNKQIAARLFISDRTVATHVGNILNKLGFNSRAQVATWMASSKR